MWSADPRPSLWEPVLQSAGCPLYSPPPPFSLSISLFAKLMSRAGLPSFCVVMGESVCGGGTVKEEQDMMFSPHLPTNHTRHPTKQHTAIRPDSTPTPTIPPGLHLQTDASRRLETCKRSSRKQKSPNRKDRKQPSNVGQMFGSKVVMTEIPRGHR